MKTRIGKIARLPRAVRQELSRRLHDGERGDRLVAWLNARTDVQAVLAAEFGGSAINAQNLSDWKRGGHRDWLAQQEAIELAERLGEDTAELACGEGPPLTDKLALWLAARYAVATRRAAETEGAEGWRLLRELCADIVELRRGDHSAQRLRMERDRFDFERESERKRTEEEFHAWAREHRDEICGSYRSPEETMKELLTTMFGERPAPDGKRQAEESCARTEHRAEDAANQGESSPFKADVAP